MGGSSWIELHPRPRAPPLPLLALLGFRLSPARLSPALSPARDVTFFAAAPPLQVLQVLLQLQVPHHHGCQAVGHRRAG